MPRLHASDARWNALLGQMQSVLRVFEQNGKKFT